MLFNIQDLQQLNYNDTLKIQQELREQIAINQSDDSLIIVEHDHVYTLGKNANPNNILNDNCKVIQTDRGGDVTYHGPGQLVIYPIFMISKLTAMYLIMKLVYGQITKKLQVLVFMFQKELLCMVLL